MPVYHTPTKQVPFSFLLEASFEEAYIKEGDTLIDLKEHVDFERYRPLVETALSAHSTRRKESHAGRPAWDPVFILKCLFLQTRHNLSFFELRKTILRDIGFRHFLDIVDPRDIPDEKTLWKYRDVFNQEHVFENLFKQDLDKLKKRNPRIGRNVVVVDSTFMVAPRQRNTREENKAIKEGWGSELWNDQPHKKCHKDIDARWTKKREETFYGYKNHTLVCAFNKLILDCYTTAANVHDAKAVFTLIDRLPKAYSKGSRKRLFLGDAGYMGNNIEEAILKKRYVPAICSKAFKGKPLTDEQKETNREISKLRSRIEHVFGFMEGSMNRITTRAIGMMRACSTAFAISWVYNACRSCFLSSSGT